MLQKSGNSKSGYGKCPQWILNSSGLKYIIKSPTPVTATSKSLIHLVITSQPFKTHLSHSIDLGISDNHLIFTVFKVARSNAKPIILSPKKSLGLTCDPKKWKLNKERRNAVRKVLKVSDAAYWKNIISESMQP